MEFAFSFALTLSSLFGKLKLRSRQISSLENSQLNVIDMSTFSNGHCVCGCIYICVCREIECIEKGSLSRLLQSPIYIMDTFYPICSSCG